MLRALSGKQEIDFVSEVLKSVLLAPADEKWQPLLMVAKRADLVLAEREWSEINQSKQGDKHVWHTEAEAVIRVLQREADALSFGLMREWIHLLHA